MEAQWVTEIKPHTRHTYILHACLPLLTHHSKAFPFISYQYIYILLSFFLIGGDGGSIPTRGEMVKLKKVHKADVNPALTASSRWRTCALSHHPLQAPVVACELGNLYNKDAVIEFIMDKKKLKHTDDFSFSHIKGLKDVHRCELVWEEDKRRSNDHVDEVRHLFLCPVTQTPANGRLPFVVMRTCGCVIAKKAITELLEDQCLNCSRPLTLKPIQEEWIHLNPTSLEEVDEMRRNMLARKAARKKSKSKSKSNMSSQDTNKKSKKRKTNVDINPTHGKQSRLGGGSINPQFKVDLSELNRTLNPKLNSIFNTAEERKAIPLLSSTKIPSGTNML